MNAMVEKVARAIYTSQWGEAQSWGVNFTETENCRSRARAAIEAMREPTEAMIASGEPISGESTVKTIYGLMIDAALR